ncbi:hypothetical protein C8F01DRAFT_1373150 [Mycena amicta]|nr:hypothetical protein C8F01DRAFT_1373150 [Mycena amicta]
MPRSPPPSHRTIVNAANVLPSVDSLLAQAPSHQRTSSQPLSPGRYPHPSTQGSPMEVDGEPNSRPAFSQSPPTSPQRGLHSPNQSMVHSPASQRASTSTDDSQEQVYSPSSCHLKLHIDPIFFRSQPMITRWVHTNTTAYPNLARTPPPVELSVIPSRMGGRYAQTQCHPNGQPHAPGLMPRKKGEEPPKIRKGRQSSVPQPNPALGIIGPISPPPSEMRKVVASREYQRAMDAAGRPSCIPCVHDIKMASLRKMVAQLGPAYAQYAHGIRPQLPTPLPATDRVVTIPFTPKPLINVPAAGNVNSTGHIVQFGVSLSEIYDFCDVLENPNDRVLEPLRLIDGSMSKIYLLMEHPGYPAVMKELEGNCLHRPVTRFSLAFSVAEAYSTYFTANPFTLRGPAQPNTIVVRSFVNLRLVNLWSADHITYHAHVAFVF